LATYRLDIEYIGTKWHGWQIQPEDDTVQGAIENALLTALRERVSTTGSGRTDAGVHACGQVAHFNTETEIDVHRLLASLNGLLPDSVAVSSVSRAVDGFHARFDARWRKYRYRLGTIPFAIDASTRWFLRPAPDISRMIRAAERLIGKNDCSSFCRTASETENRVCEIYEAYWNESQERPGNMDFVIRADRFLHGMVRAIVGTLVEIGQGKREIEDIAQILDAKDRQAAGPAAPPHGLMLEKVGYDSPQTPGSTTGK